MCVCLAALLLLSGCGHKKQTRLTLPPPPSPRSTTARRAPSTPPRAEAPRPATPDLRKHERDKVIWSEEGLASWYGPPYHNRRGANGEIFDMNQMTAAHLTIPLNSVARVTNLKTGSSAIVRITDRGPFVENRVIDLSLAAAKALDIWRAGTAQVRVEVLEAPSSVEKGGRWAVQIGALGSERAASHLKERISSKYHDVRVQYFPSPIGDWWVRVRVPQDDRKEAQEIANNTRTPEGGIYLVRLD